MTEEERLKLLASALQMLNQKKLDQCMDPQQPESRPYLKQDEIFQAIQDCPIRAVVAANQVGKSAMGGREVSWLVEGKHPYYKLPHAPKIMIIGRTTKHAETELWRDKIKPFLTPGTFKEVKTGNSLQWVEFDNGAMILFASHHNVNEAREKVQGFVLDYIWMDEMTDSVSLLAELALRVQARPHARMFITFTPLLRSVEVKNWIEDLKLPVGKRFVLHMLDNPIYAGREAEIMQRFSSMPEAERRARLYGDWYLGDNAVYQFSLEDHVEAPPGYQPGKWRHLEVIDPAGSGKTGLAYLAEQPVTGVWYVVAEAYIPGAAASDLIKQIPEHALKRRISRRVCDPHEVWFIKEAANHGLIYDGVFNKSQRKMELIKGLQKAFTEGKLKVAPWCDLTIEELTSCQWSETTAGKIVNSSAYHLADCLQYGVDSLLKFQMEPDIKTPTQALREANRQRQINESRRQRIRKSRRWRA